MLCVALHVEMRQKLPFRHPQDPGGGLLRAADYFSILTGLKDRIRTLKSCVTGVGNISDISRMEH